jgi:Asp-tRNA(Asn)/Glu-tRNA(Gln) amidotransferase C subunit
MSKEMSLEDLSSIKGATSSKAVEELFNTIKNAPLPSESKDFNNSNAVELSDLRPDEVHNSSELEKKLIKQNFPKEKNGYLVVSKVIEN